MTVTNQSILDAMRALVNVQQGLVEADAKLMAVNNLDLSGATQTLNATFASVPPLAVGHADMVKPGLPYPALDDPSFMWRAGYIGIKLFKTIVQPPWIPSGKPYPGFAWLNHELAAYPNADAIKALGLGVITASDGCLNLNAMPAPQTVTDLLPEGFTTTHISGAINSFPFSQAGGYFEIECQMPAGPGLWPAFWLIPADNQWPPEIDVFEVLGKDPTTLNVGVHTIASDGRRGAGGAIKVADVSQAFHTYGVDWDNSLIRWYVDRVLVHSEVTPTSLQNRACYLIANLAVGSPTNWGGGPDATTKFPATMKIRAIRAWKR